VDKKTGGNDLFLTFKNEQKNKPFSSVYSRTFAPRIVAL